MSSSGKDSLRRSHEPPLVGDELGKQRRHRARRQAEQGVFELVERMRAGHHRRQPTRRVERSSRDQPRPYHGRLARTRWADNRDERRARRRLDEASRRRLPTEELGSVGLAERVQALVGVHALLLQRDERATRVSPGPLTARRRHSEGSSSRPVPATTAAARHARTSSPMSPNRSEGSGAVAVRITRSSATGRSRRESRTDRMGPASFVRRREASESFSKGAWPAASSHRSTPNA